MKMMRRFLSLLLALSMVMPNFVTIASAYSDVEEVYVEEVVEEIAEVSEAEPEVFEEEIVEEVVEEVQEEASEISEEITEEVVEETAEATGPVASSAFSASSDASNALEVAPVAGEPVTAVPDMTLPSDEELFAGYFEGVMSGNDVQTLGTAGYDALTSENAKLAYNALKPVLKQIAAGTRDNAVIRVGDVRYQEEFNFPVDGETAFASPFTGEDLNQTITALLMDMPYHLYWFEKTTGVTNFNYTWDFGDGVTSYYIEFVFSVADNYQDPDKTAAKNASGKDFVDTEGNVLTYYATTDLSLTGAASATVERAMAVVNQYADLTSDYDKLAAYRDWICEQVDYNFDAVNNSSFEENVDPWQVIWAFDGDPETKIVCEGYAKAFQYLCDLSVFDSELTRCYTVQGYTGGAHMWNLMQMEDGQRYLVDLTNFDGGWDTLFLAGGTPADATADVLTYTMTNSNGGTLDYTYSEDITNLYGNEILTIATAAYEPGQSDTETDTADGYTETSLREALKSAAEGEVIALHNDLTLTGALEVPSGVTLEVYSRVDIPENTGIIVRAGGSLENNGTLDLDLGTIYLETYDAYYGGNEPEGGVTSRGGEGISAPAGTEPYLSTYWVHWENGGRFRNSAQYQANYDAEMAPGQSYDWIFYYNEWDPNTCLWKRTPLKADQLSFDENVLTVTALSEYDWNSPTEGWEDLYGYFYEVRVKDDASLWESLTRITYEGGTYPIRIWRNYERGFYAAPEATNENWLVNLKLSPVSTEEDRTFYYIVTGGNEYETYTASNVRVTKGAEYLVADENGEVIRPYGDSGKIWELTVAEEYVDLLWNHNNNLDISIDVTSTFSRCSVETGEVFGSWGDTANTWVEAQWPGVPDATLHIGTAGKEGYFNYCDPFGCFVVDGEDGPEPLVIPGVSYNAKTNTLTLNNANLTFLELYYSWYNEETGKSGTSLPNQNLTIVLEGENTITNTNVNGIYLHGGVHATIRGEGSLTITKGTNAQDWVRGFDVNPNSTLDIQGGTITINNEDIALGGFVELNGGEIVQNNANAFYVDGGMIVNSGSITLRETTMMANAALELNGGDITITNNTAGKLGMDIYSNVLVNDGNLTVSAVGGETEDGAGIPAMWINSFTDSGTNEYGDYYYTCHGTLEQYGGTITVKETSKTRAAIKSYGGIELNGGTLNADGNVGMLVIHGENENHPQGAVNGLVVNGGTLNATGSYVGLWIKAPSVWYSGSVNATAKGAADNATGIWPQAVCVDGSGWREEGKENFSSLSIYGGTHTLTSVDSGNAADASSKGISAIYAPVNMQGGEVKIDAEMAVYSVSAEETNNNFNADITFEQEDNTYTLQTRDFAETEAEGDYFHTLLADPEDNTSYVGNVTMRCYLSQEEFLAEMAGAAERGERFTMSKLVAIEGNVEIQGIVDIVGDARITVKSGATLTIPSGCEQVVHGGGELIVEEGAALINNGLLAADGGAIAVNGTYTQADSAVMNTHYRYGLMSQVEGISEGYQNLLADGNTGSQLQYINSLGNLDDYAKVEFHIYQPMTMELSSLVLNPSVPVYLHNGENHVTTLTVPKGHILTIPEGAVLNVGSSILEIAGTLNNQSNLALTGDIHLQSGAVLNNSGTLSAERNGAVIVEDGATLHNTGDLKIRLGTVFFEEGAQWNNEGYQEGTLTFRNGENESSTGDYLSLYWLGNENGGWYRNNEWSENRHEVQFTPGSEKHVVFFANKWNETSRRWNRTALTADQLTCSQGLTAVSMASQNETFAKDAEDTDCYVFLRTEENVTWGTQATVSYNGLTYNFWLGVDKTRGFYKESTASNEAWVEELCILPDTGSDYYYIITDPDWTLVKGSIQLNMGDNNQYVTFEELGNNVVKFHIKPGYVGDNDLRFTHTATYADPNEDGSSWTDTWDISIWTYHWNVNHMRRDFGLAINGTWYGYNKEFDAWWHDTDNGRVEGGYEGVSYDYDSNTVTLTDAKMEVLEFGYYEWNENGKVEGGTDHDMWKQQLTINLVGENEIISTDDHALKIYRGVQATITGDGTLYVKTDNGSGMKDENGRLYSCTPVNVGNEESSLTIAGNAKVTVEAAGIPVWTDDGGTAHYDGGMDAIRIHDGQTLTVTDNAVLNAVVPEDAKLYDHRQDGEYDRYSYRAIGGEGKLLVEKNATVNTKSVQLNNGGTLEITGGTVNIEALPGYNGGTEYTTDEEGNEITILHRHSQRNGLILENAILNISGGALNITATHTAAELANVTPPGVETGDQIFTGYYGINARDHSQVNISGGTITIDGTRYGRNISIDGDSSHLKMTGGTVNFPKAVVVDNYGENEYRWGIGSGMYIGSYSSAEFLGGTIQADNVTFEFHGSTSWGSQGGTGTTMEGNAILALVFGKFVMNGGRIAISGHKVSETILPTSQFLVNGSVDLRGGTFAVKNGKIEVNGSLDLNGADVTVDNDWNCLVGLINNNNTTVNSGSLTIRAAGGYFENENGTQFFPASINNGKYIQNGGEVSITETTYTRAAMLNYASVKLNDGVMNVSGNIGMSSIFNEGDAYCELLVEGGTLNATGDQYGLYLAAYGILNGGTINASATGLVKQTDNGQHMALSDPAAICVDYNVTSSMMSRSMLSVAGANVILTAPVGQEGTNSCGLRSYGARVMLNDDSHVEIRADVALQNTYTEELTSYPLGEYSFVNEQGQRLTLLEETMEDGSYVQTLMDGNVPAGYAKLAAVISMQTLKEGMEEAAQNNATYKVDGILEITEDIELTSIVELVNGFIFVKEGATLTIPGGLALAAQYDSQILVEAGGKIVNNGTLASDTGSITITDGDTGYVHGDGAVMNWHYRNGKQGKITGIPEAARNVIAQCATADQIQAIAALENIYNRIIIELYSDVELNMLLTIPAHVSLNVYNGDRQTTLTVAKDQTLTVNGMLNLEGTALKVDGNLVLNGKLRTGGSRITVNGSFVNNCDNPLEGWSNLWINSGAVMTNNAPFFINDGSVVYVHGQLINNQPLHVGLSNNVEAEITGRLEILGTMDNYSYLNICENAQINVYGDLYQHGKDENTQKGGVIIENHGDINVFAYGELHASYDILNYGTMELKYDFAGDGGYVGGNLYVKPGCSLKVNDGSAVIVRNGAKLVNENSDVRIRLGTVYVEDQGIYEGNCDGEITRQSDDKSDHLTAWQLEKDNKGWYWDIEQGQNRSMDLHPGEESWNLFYHNTWNTETLRWVRTPVHAFQLTNSKTDILTLEALENLDELYADNAEHTHGYVRIRADENVWSDMAEITYNGLAYPVNVGVDVRHGFYSTAEASPETWLEWVPVQKNAGEDQHFYFILTADGYTMDSLEMGQNGDKVSYEWKEGSNVVKFTVTPEMADSMTESFLIDFKFNAHNETENVTWGNGITLTPVEEDQTAWFRINETDYNLWGDGKWHDPEGSEVSLPEGVSYDYDSNTLTLTNADLTDLEVGYFNFNEQNEIVDGFSMPDQTITLKLVGANTITSSQGNPLEIYRGAHMVITGDGSLTVTANNGDGEHADENGSYYCFNAINLGGAGCALTIRGNAEVHAKVTGLGYWGSREPATLSAVQGSGGSLQLKDNGSLTAEVPEGSYRYNDIEGGTRYEAINAFGTISVYGGSLTATELMLGDGTYNQFGGTVTLNPNPGRSYNEQNVEHVHYDGIHTNGGFINISGGDLTINVKPTAEEAAKSEWYRGIAMDSGTLNISGGTVTINSDYSGTGIELSCAYGDNGPVEGTYATLNMTGGTLIFNAEPLESESGHPLTTAIWGNNDSVASFRGGTIKADYVHFELNGRTTWDGTDLVGKEENSGAKFVRFFAGGESFNINSGTLHLQGEKLDAGTYNGVSVFVAMGNVTLNGGTIDLDNGFMVIDNSLNLNGGTVDIDNDWDAVQGLVNNNYLAINSGSLNINAKGGIQTYSDGTEESFPAAINNGTIHQMGGYVHVTESTGTRPAIRNAHAVILNDGEMNVSGNVGISSFYNPEANIHDVLGLFMNGGVLNVTGHTYGLYSNTRTNFMGGIVNVQVQGDDFSDSPTAIYVDQNEAGQAYLSIMNGTLEATASDYAIRSYYAPVYIGNPEEGLKPDLTLTADVAILSETGSAEENNINSAYTFQVVGSETDLFFDTQRFSHVEGDNIQVWYDHTLRSETDASITLGGEDLYLSQAAFEEELANAQGEYTLNKKVILTRDLTLPLSVGVQGGAELIVSNGVTLTIPRMVELRAKFGGKITVEDGGLIRNYERLENIEGFIHLGDSGYKPEGETANVQMRANWNGESWVVGETTGWPVEDQVLAATCSNVDQIWAIQGLATTEGYDSVNIDIWNTLNLDSSLVIPENMNISFNSSNNSDGSVHSDLVVASGVTLTVYGSLFINNGAILDLQGTVNNYGSVHIGLWQNGNFVETGRMNIQDNGTFNSWGYLNVGPDAYMFLMPNGQLKLENDESLGCGYLQLDGRLNSQGIICSNNGALLDVNGELDNSGELVNSGEMKIFGTAASSGELTNNAGLFVVDDNARLDVSGTLKNNGEISTGNTKATINVTGTYVQNDLAVIHQPYFADGTVGNVDVPEAYETLRYEGSDAAAAIALNRYYNENRGSYRNFLVVVYGTMEVNDYLTIPEKSILTVLPGAKLVVNGTLDNQGTVNLARKRDDNTQVYLTVNSTGILRNQGTVQTADNAVVINKGTIENGNSIGTVGTISISGSYSQSGTLYQYLDSANNVGTITCAGITGSMQTLYVASPAQMAAAIEKATSFGAVEVHLNVALDGTITIPSNMTVYVHASAELSGTVTNNGTIVLGTVNMADGSRVAGSISGTITNNGTIQGYCGEKADWSVRGGILTISGSGAMTSYSTDVPAPWQILAGSITKLRIGSEITGIGAYAFAHCAQVAEVELARSITTIGENAFNTATTLKAYHQSGAAIYFNTNGIAFQFIHEWEADGDCKYYEECHVSLQAIVTDNDKEADQKLEEVKDLGLEELKEQVKKEHEDNSHENKNSATDLLNQLEEEVKEKNNTTTQAVVKDDTTKEKLGNGTPEIHRAGLNELEEGTTTVELQIEEPKQEVKVDHEQFATDSVVKVSMTLEGVKDPSDLDFAVTIVLPLPESFGNHKTVKILHYHDNNHTPEVITEEPYKDENGNWYVSFVVDKFSEFAVAVDSVAAVGMASYGTVDDALKAASANNADTITLMADGLTFNIDREMTIEKNGHTASINVNTDEFTVEDEGTSYKISRKPDVAQVNGMNFNSLTKAVKYAEDTNASTITLLCAVNETVQVNAELTFELGEFMEQSTIKISYDADLFYMEEIGTTMRILRNPYVAKYVTPEKNIYFTDISEAIRDVAEGDTITLMENVSGTFVVGKCITVELEGHTLDLQGAEGFYVVDDKEKDTKTVVKYAAKIGNSYYEDLDGAVNAAQTGDIVVLLELPEQAYTVTKPVTINVNHLVVKDRIVADNTLWVDVISDMLWSFRPYEAQVGVTKCETLADALAAVKDEAVTDKTITLLTDVTYAKPVTQTVTIHAGKFTLDIEPGEDYNMTVSEDKKTYTFTEKVYVAQIGEKKYESLQAAINEADRGAEITLLANVTEEVTVDKPMTIVRSGHSAVIKDNVNALTVQTSEEAYTVIEHIELSAFNGSLDSEIQLWLLTYLPDSFLDDEGAYVKMTMEYTRNDSTFSREKVLTTAQLRTMEPDSNGRYKLVFGVASGEMTAGIKYEFINGSGELWPIFSTSGVEYGNDVTFRFADFLSRKLKSSNENDKKIATAVAAYGGYSQEFFHVNEDDLAYDYLNEYGIMLPEMDDIIADTINQQTTVVDGNIGIKATGLNGFLDSQIYLRVYFVPDEGRNINEYKFVLTDIDFDGNQKDVIVNPVPDHEKAGRYYVDIYMPAAYMDHRYTITVTDDAGGAYSVESSMLVYIKNKLKKADTLEAVALNAARATYLYNQAANEFYGK